MVICHEKRCIFIHIPKTAGTSIEHFLREHGLNNLELIGVRNGRSTHHYRASEIKNLFPNIFHNYYKFSIVRNPYERLLSEYYWTPIKNVGFKSDKSKDEFLDYVENVIKNGTYFSNIYHDHFIPQYFFVYNKKINKIIVNQLFKYEDMEWVQTYLKQKLKIKNDFLVLNKSEKKEIWNESQKERIYNLYKKDFELFSYEK